MQLLTDENFNHRILRGLIAHLPNLDCIVVQETQLKGSSDSLLLAWGAEQRRILVTHDIKTIPKFAYERVRANQLTAGVIVVPEELGIGAAIEELRLIIECSDQNEYENRIVYLPQ
jgi:Domain of unknown function (DUF5615)